MTKRILFTLAGCTTCLNLLIGSLMAQQSDDLQPSLSPLGLPLGPPVLVDGPGPGTVTQNPAATQMAGYSAGESDTPQARLEQELQRLIVVLRDNGDGETRDKATEAVRQTIAGYFDLDMQSRRRELQGVMLRAEDIEETLTRREAAKDELVDLQIKSLELEAGGLGLAPTVRSLAENARNRGYRGMNGSGVAMMQNIRDARIAETMFGTMEMEDDPRASVGQALHAAYVNHRQAVENGDASATESALRQALSDYFDADLEVRRTELNEIQTELDKLEQSIEKRAEQRDEILQVELQLILNQADGLGFFGDSGWSPGTRWWNSSPASSMIDLTRR